MSLSEIEATYAVTGRHRKERAPSHTNGHCAHRRPARPITALADRIRALQRAEPNVVGDLRTNVLSELALIELQVERLALDAWRRDHNHRMTAANAEALAEQVDRLAVHWLRHDETARQGAST